MAADKLQGRHDPHCPGGGKARVQGKGVAAVEVGVIVETLPMMVVGIAGYVEARMATKAFTKCCDVQDEDGKRQLEKDISSRKKIIRVIAHSQITCCLCPRRRASLRRFW
ncbi:hypothetical protein J0S82_008382 [Galemys pyrenaicus]|uniref:Uncharacterized protein n=1 Tax=Galemys pyrenaicus TaxID=202257 RepID=A0A8J6DEI5_GALPY|nr:hypothetical protein J0S82_008382 [Galemys pyrenaicus]